MKIINAYIMLILTLFILSLSFIGAYWNILTIFLISFIIWLIAALKQNQLSSVKLASKYIFGTALTFILINIVAVIVLLIYKTFKSIKLFNALTISSIILLILVAMLARC